MSLNWYSLENPVNILIKASKYIANGPVVCESKPTNGLGSTKHLRMAYRYSSSSGSREFSLKEMILHTKIMKDKKARTIRFLLVFKMWIFIFVSNELFNGFDSSK